ncbi:hypothetical protein [Gulosibacter bifidus]|uniref:Lipoprotein n=1 Tax=Gulosibacter bifidus TaxID=272239 RepID=A0ABW5RLB2_9MICO|nr:hypothetical protein [Gulosibacter bifidus]
MRRLTYFALALAAVGVLSGCAAPVQPDSTPTESTTPTPLPTGQALEDCKEAIKNQVIGAQLSAEDREQQFSSNYDFEHVTFGPVDGGLSITFEGIGEFDGKAVSIECVWTPDHTTAQVIN